MFLAGIFNANIAIDMFLGMVAGAGIFLIITFAASVLRFGLFSNLPATDILSLWHIQTRHKRVVPKEKMSKQIIITKDIQIYETISSVGI